MATVKSYKRTLTYVPSFNSTEESEQKVYRYLASSLGRDPICGELKYMRTFVGATVKELLYTIILFDNTADDIDMPTEQKLKAFQQILCPAPIDPNGGP